MKKQYGNNLLKKEIKELEKQLPKLPKTYIYECNDCLHTWESQYKYELCPKCMCGDLSLRDNILEDDK